MIPNAPTPSPIEIGKPGSIGCFSKSLMVIANPMMIPMVVAMNVAQGANIPSLPLKRNPNRIACAESIE